MKKVVPLTPIESALVEALTAACLRELKNESTQDERPERVVIAAGRDVRGDKDREHDEFYSTP